MSTVRSNGIFVYHFVVIPTTVEWCLVHRFRCTPVRYRIKCHPFLRLSQSKIELTLIPRWRHHCPRRMFRLCKEQPPPPLHKRINKWLGCAHSSSRLEVRSRQLLREGAIRIIWLSMILRGRSMVVRGVWSLFAVCSVEPLQFKVAITLFEDYYTAMIRVGGGNDPRRRIVIDLCLSRERYR